jgi:negative regulator of flagellin synthesis FlgM
VIALPKKELMIPTHWPIRRYDEKGAMIMSVEIGKLSSVQPPAAPERERVSRGAGDALGTQKTSTANGRADEVKLSSSALQLKEAERGLAQQSNVDQVRVARIRDALNAGTYQVNAGRVADGILAQNRQFAGQRP